MLIDGLTFTETAAVKGSKIEEVTTLPTTGLSNGKEVILTADDGINLAGFYIYVNGSWMPLTSKTFLSTTYIQLAAPEPLTGPLILAADPVVSLGAATKHYVDTAISAIPEPVVFSGGTLTTALILAADPTVSMGAATKAYVDVVAQGLNPKVSCRVATTGNIALSGLQTIDAVLVNANDRVLVKDQTTASQNGFYLAKSGSWIRTVDADGSPVEEVQPGAFTYISEGTANGTITFVLITPGTITIGTTALTFSQMSGASALTMGTGLTQTLNVLSVNLAGIAGTGLLVSGSTLALDKTAIPYDVAGSVIGKATASASIMTFKTPRAFTLDLASSTSWAAVAATASAVFSINKNGTQVATMTYAAAGSVGTFSSQPAVSFAANDILTVVAPSVADATLSDVSFALTAVLA